MSRMKASRYLGYIDLLMLAVVLLVSYGVFAVFIDLEGPYLLTGSALSLVYANMPWLFIGYGCFFVALCRPMFKSSPLRFAKLLIGLAYVAALIDLYVNPLESTRVFLTDLYSSRSGDPVERVQARMAKYWQVDSAGLGYQERFEPDYTGSVSFIHGLDPDRNGDIGTVSFSNGRVDSVSFYPD